MNADVKAKLNAFLTGLEGPSKQRLSEVVMSLYDAHANSFPGPDSTMKKTLRPHLAKWVDSFITDLGDGV